MVSFLRKPVILFCASGIWFTIGIVMLIFWDNMSNFGLTFFGVEIFHRCYESMGRFGFSALMFGFGALMLFQGIKLMKENKQKQQ